MLQTNNTGMCLQCLRHTGPAPAYGSCALPAHTAQALGCFTGNRPRSALGCLHLPGLSRSGSGTQIVLRGADSAGPAFCALSGPYPSQDGDENPYLPGASTGDPTHDKVMRRRPDKQSFRTQGTPWADPTHDKGHEEET